MNVGRGDERTPNTAGPTSPGGRPSTKRRSWQLQFLADGLGLIPDSGQPRYIERAKFAEQLTLTFLFRGVLLVRLDGETLVLPIPAATYPTVRKWLGPPPFARLVGDLRRYSVLTILLGGVIIAMTWPGGVWHRLLVGGPGRDVVSAVGPVVGLVACLLGLTARFDVRRLSLLLFAGCWAVIGALDLLLASVVDQNRSGATAFTGCMAASGVFALLFAGWLVALFRNYEGTRPPSAGGVVGDDTVTTAG